MTASDAERLIIRPKEAYDGALPSGNSVAALVLLKLFVLTKNEIYKIQIDSLFVYFSKVVSQAPYAYSFLLSALDFKLNGPLELTIEGVGEDPELAKWHKILYTYFMPYKAVRFIPTLKEIRAHVCYQGTCRPPVDSVEGFEREILKVRDKR